MSHMSLFNLKTLFIAVESKARQLIMPHPQQSSQVGFAELERDVGDVQTFGTGSFSRASVLALNITLQERKQTSWRVFRTRSVSATSATNDWNARTVTTERPKLIKVKRTSGASTSTRNFSKWFTYLPQNYATTH